MTDERKFIDVSVDVICAIRKPYVTKIAELEEENKELKEKYSSDKRSISLIIKKANEEINELKKDKEWLDTVNNEQTEFIIKLNDQLSQINDICDYVLDGTTHWDEEQLEDFFKQIKKIL